VPLEDEFCPNENHWVANALEAGEAWWEKVTLRWGSE